MGGVSAFLEQVERGYDLGVAALIDETYLPEEGRARATVLTRRRIVERVAHNVWGESAGHRSSLDWDDEWKAAQDVFEEIAAVLAPEPAPPPATEPDQND